MTMSDLHVLVFDPYATGHHGQYIRMLLEHWVERGLRGCLDLALSPEFASAFPAAADYATRHAHAGIRRSSLTTDGLDGRSVFGLVRQDVANGRMIAEVVRDRKPDHCLLMYFDHAQLSLWKGLRFDFPVSISGIYFRPSFHYTSIGSPPFSLRERLDRWRKRTILRGALRNPHLTTVFSLDPFAVEHVNEMTGRETAVSLPDGVRFDRRKVDGDTFSRERRTALLFGSLDTRKGVVIVLESLELLPARMQDRLRLALVGPVSKHERGRILASIERARASTRVDISLEDGYVPTGDVQSRIGQADFVLITYQRHVGSSNVLVRAAAAGRPVLGSDYGVVGAQIRRNALGVAVDTTSRTEIAEALGRFVEHPDSIPFDEALARQFADANSADRFAETIFSRVREDVDAESRYKSI